MSDEIVVVDDDAMTAELITRVLRQHPWGVRSFTDPLEALDYLGDETPQLLIVDTRMPAMDGPELLVRLYALGRLADTPVLLASAGPQAETEWTRQLPAEVERVSKSAIYDRTALRARLAELSEQELGDPAGSQVAPSATSPVTSPVTPPVTPPGTSPGTSPATLPASPPATPANEQEKDAA